MLMAVAPLLAAVFVQLLPLPIEIRPSGSGLSPFLSSYEPGFAADAESWHPLTISPELTWRAALILSALVTLVLGLESRLTNRQELCPAIAYRIATVGAVVALFALIQKATFNGKIYWFWESQFRASSNYYGPFVNRNHFAGWMLLVAALTSGLLMGQIQTMGRQVRNGWRNRVLWLASEEASRVLLTTAALLVMLVSIMWSMSRSGIAGTALALTVLSAAALRRFGNAARNVVAAGAVVMLLFLAVTWRGTDTLAAWYGRTETFEWRVQLWKDTLPAIADFWIAGSGLNTYSPLMLLYAQSDQKVHAAQAHSDYVQLAVEGGVLVGVPMLILLGLLAREIRRRIGQREDEVTRWIRLGAVAGICGMALQEAVEFSLQIPGIAVLFAVLVAIAIHPSGAPPREPLLSRTRH